MFAPNKCINNWPKNIKNIPVTKEFDRWRDGKGVLITTWGKFKGLEADAIVIIESPDHQDNLTNANRYVSRSRAKYVLTVFQVESRKI